MKQHFVRDFDAGQSVQDVFVVHERDFRQARNGSHYISLVLGDRTGRVNARKWDARRDEYDFVAGHDFVRIRGRVETYRSQLQLILQHVAPADRADVHFPDFLPRSERPPEEMFDELADLLGSVRNPHLQALLSGILSDADFARAFRDAPAAVRVHHAYVGGLVEHTLAMARAAQALAPLYPRADADLLLAGVFFHDVGKIRELEASPQLAYTDEGYLLGHIFLGARFVEQRIEALEGFPSSLRTRLLHMILSHHGQHDFGSPVLPMTLEAFLLHYLDNIDAKARIFLDATDRAREEGESWTGWLGHMERRLFAGNPEEDG